MNINTNQIVPIPEANEKFSRIHLLQSKTEKITKDAVLLKKKWKLLV